MPITTTTTRTASCAKSGPDSVPTDFDATTNPIIPFSGGTDSRGAVMTAEVLTKDLGGCWHGSYGTAGCPAPEAPPLDLGPLARVLFIAVS